jgi:hypothetical protein
VFVAAAGSNQTAKASSTKLYFNPNTGQLSATDFNSLSDITFKENIVPLENALNKVSEMRGVSYNFIDTKQKAIGVIAQEIEQILPEVVNLTAAGHKTVSYGNIVGILIEAIKELKAEVDKLKNK